MGAMTTLQLLYLIGGNTTSLGGGFSLKLFNNIFGPGVIDSMIREI